MEIIYRLKEPCNIEPAINSTGGYAISQNGVNLFFDFEEIYAGTYFENGYLYNSTQKNLDETVLGEIPLEIIYTMIKSAKKEDFTEIYNEWFADEDET